jgi:hypothetical protein
MFPTKGTATIDHSKTGANATKGNSSSSIVRTATAISVGEAEVNTFLIVRKSVNKQFLLCMRGRFSQNEDGLALRAENSMTALGQSRRLRPGDPFPVYPEERTSADPPGMSVSRHKRTCRRGD